MTSEEIAVQVLVMLKHRFEGQPAHTVFLAVCKVAHALAGPAGLRSFETKIRYPKKKKIKLESAP